MNDPKNEWIKQFIEWMDKTMYRQNGWIDKQLDEWVKEGMNNAMYRMNG